MNKVREGYKTTELGDIPEEWKVMKLSEIANINPRREIVDDKSMVSFIAMEDISNSGRVTNKSDKLYEEVKKGYTPFVDNDVLLAKITPCFENGKRALVDNLSNSIGFGSTEFHVLRANKYSISKFLYYVISSQSFVSKAKNNMTGSAGQKRVPTEFIKDYMLVVPKLEEQEKIASILSTVDEQIDNVDALIEKNKELKKGLMQQLLTKGIGHTKFKNTEFGKIPEDWEVKKLKDLGNSIIGLTYSPDDLVEEDEGTLVLRSSNIKNSRIVFDDNKYVRTNIQDKLIVKEDDILICSRNGSKDLIGKCALIDKKTEGSTFGAFMTVYRSEYNKYLFNVFTSYMFKRQIYNNLGATINQITTDNLNNFKVILPPVKDQEEIASILLKVDEKVDEYVNKKEKLEELKKGLMQELLTGKFRII